MSEHPRLLFITNEPPHTAAAGSIYFHRLFEDYPAERLHILTNRAGPASAERLPCRYSEWQLPVDRLSRTRFWKWRTALRVVGAGSLLSLGKIDRLIGGFRPDAIVTLMQDSWYYELAARYAKSRKLPLVLFVHDLPHGFEPVANGLLKRQRERDLEIYRQAAVRLCVSEGMEAWFKADYGLPGEVMHPPRSPRIAAQEAEVCRGLKNAGRLTLGYAGGLHYGYGEQIAAMLPVLRATGSRLKLSCPPPSGKLSTLQEDGKDVLEFLGYAPTPEEAWSRIVSECDAVLLPYLNPPGNHHLQYQTHFPSKLGDMLSLGLPLLVTGPEDASGMHWCRTNGDFSVCVSDPSPAALEAAIASLRDDPALRVRLARAAGTAAKAFDAGALKIRLNRHLSSLSR